MSYSALNKIAQESSVLPWLLTGGGLGATALFLSDYPKSEKERKRNLLQSVLMGSLLGSLGGAGIYYLESGKLKETIDNIVSLVEAFNPSTSTSGGSKWLWRGGYKWLWRIPKITFTPLTILFH